MRKLSFLAVLLGVLAFSGIATQNCYGMGVGTGDGSDYRQIQETAIFFNNSGSTLAEGDVVVLDVDGDGVSTGSTLGSYVTTTADESDTHYGADSVLAVGVVKSTSVADQRPIAVVTKGPALTTCEDSDDAVTEFTAVGTVGQTLEQASCGGGTNLGVALEAGDGTDNDQLIIWVDPTGSD